MENKLKDLLTTVGESISRYPSGERCEDPMNLFRVLEIQRREVYLCRVLAKLIDPAAHDKGAAFLKLFFDQVLKLPATIYECQKAAVYTEYVIDEKRRIDIYIQSEKYNIPIEAKVDAGDQKAQLPQIKGGNSMKKLFAIILALVCCLSLMACSSDETVPGTTEPPQVQQPTKPSADSATQETNKPNQPTQPVVTQPQQNMCYWCGEMPVGDFETYCINCRCLKCDKLRKDGGGKYVYCRDHNCNESLCEYPAFEDSQYCSEHKCSKPNCDNRRWPGSEYCAHHK